MTWPLETRKIEKEEINIFYILFFFFAGHWSCSFNPYQTSVLLDPPWSWGRQQAQERQSIHWWQVHTLEPEFLGLALGAYISQTVGPQIRHWAFLCLSFPFCKVEIIVVPILIGSIVVKVEWMNVELIHINVCVCVCVCVCVSRFSRVWLFVTPRTVACQAPLFMGFSRQEY